MAVYSEESEALTGALGIYTDELQSFIPDGFCLQADNFVAKGSHLEARKGFDRTAWTYSHNLYNPLNIKLYYLNTNDIGAPSLVWGTGNNFHLIRSRSYIPAAIVGDDYMTVNPSSGQFQSACTYGGKIYFKTTAGIKSASDFNWATPGFILSAEISAPTLSEIFIFKDRMWGYGNDGNLYFTQVATFGGFPEVWNAATQNVAFGGPSGSTKILQVIPVGSKLIVFTDSGVFSLHVEGRPASWIKRELQPDSVSNTNQAATEYAGVVYYVNNMGVWATNGLSVNKISSAIDNFFEFQSGDDFRFRTLNMLDEGLLVSSVKLIGFGIGGLAIDSTSGEHFYTKLNNIAWTSFSFKRHHTGTAPTAELGIFNSITPLAEALMRTDRKQFVLFVASKSIVGVPIESTLNLAVYDGYQDDYYAYDGSTTPSTTQAVECAFESKATDGKFPSQIKRLKYALIDVYNLGQHRFLTSWRIDDGSTVGATTINTTSPGQFSNYITIVADFMYRQTSFVVKALTTSSTPLKFRGVTMVKHTERRDDFNAR